MQKKIIALAIAAALATPALALAEVSVSGQVNMSIDMVKDGVANSGSSNNLNSNQSRIVFKGSEDLGNGMSAIFALDNRFTADDGLIPAGKLFTGNTYLGVKSNDFGTVRVGVLDSVYKSSTRNLDVFFDVAGDNRSGVGSIGGVTGLLTHDKRYNNAINYNSPDMGGLSVAVSTVFGAEHAASGDTKGTLYSLAGMYNAGGIYGTLAYESIKQGTVGDLSTGAVDDKVQTLKVGGGFSMDVFTVNAVIEMPKSTVAATGTETKNTNVYVGGKFGISDSDFVRAAYTIKGESKTGGTNNNDKASQIAVGYSHDMSKATSVYATYVKTTDDKTGNPDPSVFSFGMKHSF